MIFQGPHAYVSPSWYTTAPAVPTWNYAAVHVYGVPRLLDEAGLLDVVSRLVDQYESGRERPWIMDLPEDYQRKMLRAIVGFEVPISRIEGKFKLNQNRSAEDRAGVIEALAAGDAEEQVLAEFMSASRRIEPQRTQRPQRRQSILLCGLCVLCGSILPPATEAVHVRPAAADVRLQRCAANGTARHRPAPPARAASLASPADSSSRR